MADYLPKFKLGQAVTFTATADVTGGRLVEASTMSRGCAPAGADSAKIVGVAAFDAPSGDTVGVFCRPTGVHQLTAAGAIAAGSKVASAAAGKVQTIASLNNPIGVALETAFADGDVIDVMFI